MKRDIPTKNYYIVLVVSILVIIFTLYIRSFYLNYQAANSNVSIFENKSINQMNIDDLDYAINEMNNGFLFISYNGDVNIRMMEKRLYRLIESKKLNDFFLYLNITDSKEESLNIFKNKYPMLADKFKNPPILIYIKDGELEEVIDSSSELVSEKTLNTLLTKYGIE